MLKNYIILGPPGSGKGTQARKLADKLDYVYFGTGDLMRREAELNTALGLEFKKVWDEGKGKLISEELVQKFVAKKVDELEIDHGVVFDGYPRTIAQAEHLEKILSKKHINNVKVINLVVDAKLLVLRMQTRRVCDKCQTVFEDPNKNGITKCDRCGGNLVVRVEDQFAVLTKRIDVYNQQTLPLISFFKNKGTLINVDGNPSIEKVWENIQKVTT
ncbi:MAG: Adenylate kinase [Berkelbacteria bacterium GW2011_GWB1_38_5]|uniref:Adenylate kinase n=2 Tax=Candidatus Berkelbacteria TaxID=1618330 RepID=A0A0G0NYK5_9BACT|nr:MAG: Adenylate kinase [Berkelbacteria bacterium GW2011_GWB1_38_5]KKQ90954.1 MAG: Adenylate kinase [Berkelbacteria bacterium GW2011_GWA1_39_10]